MPRKKRYTDEQFIEAVANNTSVRQVLLSLGLNATGGNYQACWNRIQKFDLDTSHFKGQGWNTTRGVTNFAYVPAEEYLGTDKRISSYKLKQKLLKEELFENVCSECKQDSVWNNKILNMHLDHINGNRNDNRLENLRLLCPNCHSQTSTYSGRNKGNGCY